MATAGHLYDDGARIKPFVLAEAPGSRSRSLATLTQSGVALKSGTVLALSSGKYVPYTNVAPADVAAAILYEAQPARTGDVKVVVFDTDCEVNRFELTGLDAAGEADLLLKGIKVRGNANVLTVGTPAL